MQYESEYPLSGVTLGIFPRKSQQCQWRTWWKISPRYYGYGKVVPREVDLKYFGRLLLDTEEGCTWCQILSKVIRLYSLEECFCLFHVHVKYYVAHLNSLVSLKPCAIEKFCIPVRIQHKNTAEFIYWSSWDKKKVIFCWPVWFIHSLHSVNLYKVWTT